MNNRDLSLPNDFVFFVEEDWLGDVVVGGAFKTSDVCAVGPVGVPMMSPRNFDGVSVPSVVFSVEHVLPMLYEFLGMCKVAVDNEVLARVVDFHKLNIRK